MTKVQCPAKVKKSCARAAALRAEKASVSADAVETCSSNSYGVVELELKVAEADNKIVHLNETLQEREAEMACSIVKLSV